MEPRSLHLILFSAFCFMPALCIVHGYITTEDLIHGDIFFEIVEPEKLQHSYRTRPAKDFGPSFPTDFMYENIFLVPVDPPEGCGKSNNFRLLADSVAFVDRGGCSFAEKVFHAEEAGAVAVIISDNVESDEYFLDMLDDGFERELNIPTSFLLGKNGLRIRRILRDLEMDYALINIPRNFTYTPLTEWNQPPWIPW